MSTASFLAGFVAGVVWLLLVFALVYLSKQSARADLEDGIVGGLRLVATPSLYDQETEPVDLFGGRGA
jgi:hypothetical protein